MGKSPENHKQECKSAGLVSCPDPFRKIEKGSGHETSAGHVASYRSSTAAAVACNTNNGVRSVICTASDDSCGGGLGTRLRVMHERSRICRFAHAKMVTFELIKKS